MVDPPCAPGGPPESGAAPGLNRDRILRQALALIDAGGAGALSMRRLGSALGVEAMSLYHHVANREALLDGVAEVMVAGLPVAPPGTDWAAAVREFAGGIRRIALARPAAFQLVGMRPLAGPGALRPIAALLARLREAGLDPAAAVAGYRLTAAFARGFVLAEIGGLTLARAQDRPGGPAALAEFAAPLGADPAQMFHRGVETIVAGLRVEIAAAGAARPQP